MGTDETVQTRADAEIFSLEVDALAWSMADLADASAVADGTSEGIDLKASTSSSWISNTAEKCWASADPPSPAPALGPSEPILRQSDSEGCESTEMFNIPVTPTVPLHLWSSRRRLLMRGRRINDSISSSTRSAISTPSSSSSSLNGSSGIERTRRRRSQAVPVPFMASLFSMPDSTVRKALLMIVAMVAVIFFATLIYLSRDCLTLLSNTSIADPSLPVLMRIAATFATLSMRIAETHKCICRSIVDLQPSGSIATAADMAALIVTETEDHVMNLVQDLRNLPSPFNLSLSADAANSLAGTIFALIESTPHQSNEYLAIVADAHAEVLINLRDLSDSLTATSDALLALFAHSHTSLRAITRRLSAILSPRTTTQSLELAIDDVDRALTQLESLVHDVTQASQRTQSIQRLTAQASEVAEQRALVHQDQAESDVARSSSWWWGDSDRAIKSKALMRRIRRDVAALQNVGGRLRALAPDVVKLDGDVKTLRMHLGMFRGGVSAWFVRAVAMREPVSWPVSMREAKEGVRRLIEGISSLGRRSDGVALHSSS